MTFDTQNSPWAGGCISTSGVAASTGACCGGSWKCERQSTWSTAFAIACGSVKGTVSLQVRGVSALSVRQRASASVSCTHLCVHWSKRVYQGCSLSHGLVTMTNPPWGASLFGLLEICAADERLNCPKSESVTLALFVSVLAVSRCITTPPAARTMSA